MIEDKALDEILEDIDMDDFHYAIKFGRKREDERPNEPIIIPGE